MARRFGLETLADAVNRIRYSGLEAAVVCLPMKLDD
jgi:hypothetical protein